MFYTGMKWLNERAKYRGEMLGSLREEAYKRFGEALNTPELYGCYIAARIEFGTATREVCTPSVHMPSSWKRTLSNHISDYYFKSDDRCKIAEWEDSEAMRTKLLFVKDKTCEEMPRLCVEIAGGNENSITLEAISEAEQILFKRFIDLGQHAAGVVRRVTFQL